MKKIINFVFVTISVILLYSCTTSQKVTVQGAPGTEIYSPRMEKLGVIGSNARVSFKISSDDYFSYLMSKDAETNELVPFALDYKYHSYTGTKALTWTGYTITTAGLFSLLVAGGTALGGDFEEVGTPFLIGGFGAALLGSAIGVPADMRSKQTQYTYKYKYLSTQNTNQDIKFLPIKDVGYKKDLELERNTSANGSYGRRKATTETSSVANGSGSVSKRTLGNYGKLLSGTYTGTGYLTQSGKAIEEYASINVVVTRIDNSNVWIDVIESGESFFSSKSKYQITKKGKNTYVLSLKDVSDAYITIDSNGALTYMHPKVNIDGEIYTLNINAKKK